MSYHDDLFPKDIAYGARGGPTFNTTVLELGSGYERRNRNWKKVRARYNVAYGVKTPQQMDSLLHFFYARNGRAFSFPYFDWKDHTIKNQLIGTGDGVTRNFQIFKRYSSGSHYYDREITKIVPDTVGDIYVGGIPNTAYTLDYLTGIITFDDPPVVDDPITLIECQFYVHVRFDTDFADIQLITYQAETWTDIVLVEIKEDN